MRTITVYRSRPMFGALRRATVLLDGETVGTLRGRQRLSVRALNGRHEVAVRLGGATSRPLAVEIDDADVVVAIRSVLPANRRSGNSAEDYLELVPVAGFDDRSSVTLREVYRSRPAVGYRRLRGWERAVFAFAFAVAIGAQLMRHTLGSGVSLAIAGPAEIVLVVLIVRLFIYRPDK